MHDPAKRKPDTRKMRVRAFVFDIDGTICDYDGLLNLEAVHTIRWLRNLGYTVFLASGRGPWDTFYLGVFLGCTSIAVCENGGVLMTSPSEIKVYSDKAKSLEAYDLLCRHFPDVKIKPVSARLTEVVLLRTFDVKEGQKILDENGIPITINDSKFALHLSKKGLNKGKTLLEALRVLEIDPENVVAIGDSDTDVPMFEVCGYSAAVGNAPKNVKSKAKFAAMAEIGDGAVEAVSYIMHNVI
ncbi:MAG: phosphoglycolate phosphatase, partial [Nitrososphaerales archaeon]